jgi:predicted transcriptional regulator
MLGFARTPTTRRSLVAYDYTTVVQQYPQDRWDALENEYRSSLNVVDSCVAVDLPVEHGRFMLKALGHDLNAKRSNADIYVPLIRKELAETDDGVRAIAERLGISYPTANRYCKEAGLVTGLNDRRWARWGDRALEWLSEGRSVQEIHRLTSITYEDLCVRLKAAGGDVRVGPRAGHAPKREALWPEVRRLNEEGWTDRRIALQVGASEHTVGVWLRAEGRRSIFQSEPKPDKPDGRRGDKRSPQCISAIAMMDEGDDNAEIAETLEVTRGIVSQWRSKYRPDTVARKLPREAYTEQVLALFDSGKIPPSQIHLKVGTSFYVVQTILAENKRSDLDGSYNHCGHQGCERIVGTRQTYCSREHAAANTEKRKPDPENWYDYVCPNSVDPNCLSHGGKTLQARFSQPRTYCSTHCAAVMIPRQGSSHDLSTYEKFFEGTCALLKVRYERFPRETDCVYFDNSDPTLPGMTEYGPDYWVHVGTKRMAVEVKGRDGEAQHAKWAAWSAQRPEPLYVLFQDDLKRLSAAPTRTEFFQCLWSLQWNGEGDTPPDPPQVV